MPEIVECDCIVELAIPQKLDQIFCVLSTLASGEAGDATAANQQLEIAQLEAIEGNTDALPAALGQAAMAASLPVVIASDQSSVPVTVASQGYSQQVNVTRPANVTPYGIGDVVGGAFEITTIGPSAGRIMLTNVNLLPQIAAVPAGMTSFRLHLYNVTPPSAIADNSPWLFPSGDWASYLGYVDIGTPVDFGDGLFVQAVQLNQQIKLATTSLFAYLVTATAYTPAANSEVYRVEANSVSV